MNNKILTIVIMVFVTTAPLTVAAENLMSPNSDSRDDPYDLKRNFSAFEDIIEIDEAWTDDYICGGNSMGIHGDDCSYDQSTMKGLYRETIENGTRFDQRKVTVTNYGEPHEVDLDVFVCYRMPISNSAPNNLDCQQAENDLGYGQTGTFKTSSHLGDEFFVYLIGREGTGGDQTKFGIKIERVFGEGSNADQVEPRILNTTSVIADQVCQKECDSTSDRDRSDAFTMAFHKGDSFEIQFWSTECEPSNGNINYQIYVLLFLWRPSSPESPTLDRWSLNEQDCGRDYHESFTLTGADEGGDLLLLFIASSDHEDGNPASYEVQLVEHDLTYRDMFHDEDQDGFTDVQESECLTNYRYGQDTPVDTDGDQECDYLDHDDDGDGILDNDDNCPNDFYEGNTGLYGDHDSDGCQNIIDSDDDNDGVDDPDDLCPLGELNTTAIQSNDFDGDGCLDVEDSDDDNDMWSDYDEENCLTDTKNSDDFPLDFDGDLICDVLDVDDDGDGFDDGSDSFPQNPQEWDDTDGDGIGNNADSDDDGDGVKDVDDAFPLDPTQSSDFDDDGCGDNPTGLNGDQFPNEPTQCSDSDGDGYGDNQGGVLPDSFPYDSTQWSDMDGDSFGDNPNGVNADAFPFDATQWFDGDGDGYGDNLNGNSPDAFPTVPTQMMDTDGDGYGDNPSGFEGDSCPLINGKSYRDVYGCLDIDFDGWSDDGDDCPSTMGSSHFDRKGCSDSDSDGVSDPDASSQSHPTGLADAFPYDTTQSRDIDGDGYGDNISGQNKDDCIFEFGNSSVDVKGCLDRDGDGVSEVADRFPTDASQWFDSDDDGFGDNPKGQNADQCPDQWGNSTSSTAMGCLDTDGDGIRDDDDHCSGGNNHLQDTRNTCIAAVLSGDLGLGDIIAAQGATLLLISPLLYLMFVLRPVRTTEDDDSRPYDSD